MEWFFLLLFFVLRNYILGHRIVPEYPVRLYVV